MCSEQIKSILFISLVGSLRIFVKSWYCRVVSSLSHTRNLGVIGLDGLRVDVPVNVSSIENPPRMTVLRGLLLIFVLYMAQGFARFINFIHSILYTPYNVCCSNQCRSSNSFLMCFQVQGCHRSLASCLISTSSYFIVLTETIKNILFYQM